MSRFSEALVGHRRKTLSVEKEWLYAALFCVFLLRAGLSSEENLLQQGSTHSHFRLCFWFHQRKSGRPLLVWPQPCKKIRQTLEAQARCRGKGCQQGAHSSSQQRQRPEANCCGMVSGWRQLEKAGSRIWGGGGQTAAWKKVSNHSPPKTNTESTEKQDCPFQVLEGENRF